jgi:hypothetical protein
MLFVEGDLNGLTKITIFFPGGSRVSIELEGMKKKLIIFDGFFE